MPEATKISGETKGKLRTALEGLIVDGSEKSMFFSSSEMLAANSTLRLLGLDDERLSTGVRLYNAARGLDPLEVKARFEIVDILTNTKRDSQGCQNYREAWDRMIRNKLRAIHQRTKDKHPDIELIDDVHTTTTNELQKTDGERKYSPTDQNKYDELVDMVVNKHWEKALANLNAVRQNEDQAISTHTGKRADHRQIVEDQRTRIDRTIEKIDKKPGFAKQKEALTDMRKRTDELLKTLNSEFLPSDEANIKNSSSRLTARFDELEQKIKRFSSH